MIKDERINKTSRFSKSNFRLVQGMIFNYYLQLNNNKTSQQFVIKTESSPVHSYFSNLLIFIAWKRDIVKQSNAVKR